jgi:hypothetical protein
MKAIYYNITHTKVPSLMQDFHVRVECGYGYELDNYFVHFYGNSVSWYGIHTGLTVIEEKKGTIKDWIEKYFGAQNIRSMDIDVGESTEGVWRSGLYYFNDTCQALNTSLQERTNCEQALRILLEKLDDLFLYIEPDIASVNTYSHKTRELLILACTEVENFWIYYMTNAKEPPLNGKNYTTKDYVKLRDSIFLKEYECSLYSYLNFPAFKPFGNWGSKNPTVSLPWYDAYNKTKHNRTTHFSEATFYNALQAVVANIVMYIVRFSPFPMQEDKGTFNSLVNQYFRFKLVNPDLGKSYLPLIKIPTSYRKDIFLYDSREANDLQKFIVKPFVL